MNQRCKMRFPLTVISKVSRQVPPATVLPVLASTVLPVPWMLKVSKSRRSLQTSERKERSVCVLP